MESNTPSKAGHLHIQEEEGEQENEQIRETATFLSSPRTLDLLEVGQQGLNNISLKRDGVYNEIILESYTPSKAGHLHIHGEENEGMHEETKTHEIDTKTDSKPEKEHIREAAIYPSSPQTT